MRSKSKECLYGGLSNMSNEGFTITVKNGRTLTVTDKYYSLRGGEGHLMDAVRFEDIIQCEVSAVKQYALVIEENDQKPAEEWETLAGEKCELFGGTHYLYFDNSEDLLKVYYFIRRHT